MTVQNLWCLGNTAIRPINRGFTLASSEVISLNGVLHEDKLNYYPTHYIQSNCKFLLYHELVSDRSIVLDITWDYTMAWYPAHKISEL